MGRISPVLNKASTVLISCYIFVIECQTGLLRDAVSSELEKEKLEENIFFQRV